jgi:FtsP/CotA-like multicopper oxidase with cupredoxin domain
MKRIRTHQRMSAIKRKLWLVLGVVPLVSVALVAFAASSASSAASALPPTGIVCATGAPSFTLKTGKGQVTTPDGNGVFMWGFTTDPGSFQMPGPILCVNEGDTVSVTLTNTAVSEAVSIVFPGQTGVSASGGCAGLFTQEASAACGSVTYTFTAGEPGTYLYESGTSPHKQVQMGLYGALIVRPALGASYAYNDPQTRFSQEYLVLLNEIDPDLHRAVENGKPYNITTRRPGYWHVNGRSFPDTIADNGVPWLPSQPYGALVRVEPFDALTNQYPVLIRYANAGMDNHPLHPHGNHLRVIARDGRVLRGPGGEDTSFEDFTRTIGSGQSYDLLFRWDDVDPWITGGAPVPVTIPNLQNLVFKDGATFYSGDPRLGEQGELPVGVTSFNQCGEFYFPWHSHALFEFTNFDEGFGGLSTLLRVDPPGGCP